MRVLVGLLRKPARSAREFVALCETTPEQARKVRSHLEGLELVRVTERARGPVAVKAIELTRLGVEVARLLQRVEEMLEAPPR